MVHAGQAVVHLLVGPFEVGHADLQRLRAHVVYLRQSITTTAGFGKDHSDEKGPHLSTRPFRYGTRAAEQLRQPMRYVSCLVAVTLARRARHVMQRSVPRRRHGTA